MDKKPQQRQKPHTENHNSKGQKQKINDADFARCDLFVRILHTHTLPFSMHSSKSINSRIE